MKPKFNTENYLRTCGFKNSRELQLLAKSVKCKYLNRVKIVYQRNKLFLVVEEETKYRCKYSADKLNEMYKFLTGEK